MNTTAKYQSDRDISATEKVRTSQVNREITDLDQVVKEIHGCLESLEQRINPIVRPPDPSGPADREKAEEVVVQLADRLRIIRHGLEAIRNHINSLTSRIEL